MKFVIFLEAIVQELKKDKDPPSPHCQSARRVSPSLRLAYCRLVLHTLALFSASLASWLICFGTLPFRYRFFGCGPMGGAVPNAAARTSAADLCGERKEPFGDSTLATRATKEKMNLKSQLRVPTVIEVGIIPGSTPRTEMLLRFGSKSSRC
jgi:hypothetical protein